MMTKFDKQSLVEIVLYVLEQTGGIDYYRLFKILYFAELELLANYGQRITTDEFHALPDGPVPTLLYHSIKHDERGDNELSAMIDEAITQGNEDAYYMLLAKRSPDMEYISNAEKIALDHSISENAKLSYDELRRKSHGNEWERAYNTYGEVMNVVGMAKEAKASDAMIEYISEMQEVEAALS